MDWWIAAIIGFTFAWTYNQQCEINRIKKEIENIKHKINILTK